VQYFKLVSLAQFVTGLDFEFLKKKTTKLRWVHGRLQLGSAENLHREWHLLDTRVAISCSRVDVEL
jgi:hypothetical protein